MIEKPYGKFTLEQLKQITGLVHQSKNLAPTFEKVMRETDPKKLKAIVGENFSWFHYYEKPFNEHIGWAVVMLDWQDDLRRAAQSEDPQQHFLDFFTSIDPDKDWQGGFQGLFEKRDLMGLLMSIIRTMKSIMVYQKSLSTLIEEVRLGNNNDKSLFDAVRIDRTMLACPSIMHRISMAELKGDNNFFLHLKSAIKGPSGKHWVTYEELRYMMQALVESGVDRFTGDNIEQLFVEHLKLYKQTPGAQKNLLKQFLETLKVNHRK